MKTLSKAIAIASLVTASALTAQAAQAEVEYSAGIATTYLWRGTDLGGAAFSAAADYAHESGAYAGVWASSGDSTDGNEYDLSIGFAKEFGPVAIDASLWTYTYNAHSTGTNGSPGENAEVVLSASAMDASVTYYQSLQNEDATYLTLGYSVAGADITYGMIDSGTKYSHLDVSYGLTDELGLSVSKPIDDDAGVDEDVILVVSYSIPLK